MSQRKIKGRPREEYPDRMTLEKTLPESRSFPDLARKLGLSLNAKDRLRRRAVEWGLNFTHHTRKGVEFTQHEAYKNMILKKREREKSRFLNEIAPILFVRDSVLDGKRARKFILTWNPVFQWLDCACQKCDNRGEWLGEKLTLQLDHKNGDSRDHRLENLRFLCQNCHSQTETFCGRNIRRASS